MFRLLPVLEKRPQASSLNGANYHTTGDPATVSDNETFAIIYKLSPINTTLSAMF